MKNIAALILLICTWGCYAGCKNYDSKYFAGTVEYAYSYSSDSLNTDSLTAARPAKGTFRYDENNYQSKFTGNDTFTYFYSGSLNKCISETGLQQNYECEDYGLATDPVVSVKLYDTDEKVLGFPCRIIEIQKTRSFVKYYVSRNHIMAPATYQKHRSYNWDLYGEKTGGGLVLKSEHRFKIFTMKGIATALEVHNNNFSALEIDEKLFTRHCK